MTKLKQYEDEFIDIRAYFKLKREERGYTYGDVAGDYLHRTQIARFEKGEHAFSADALLLAIRGLNMTPHEFFALMPKENFNKIHEFRDQLFELASLKETEKMKMLLKKRAKSKIDRIKNVMLKITIYQVCGEDLITSSDCAFIITYLENIKQWTKFEVHIFDFCLTTLADEDIYELGMDMLKSNELSQLITSHRVLVKRTMLHLFANLVYRNRYSYARHMAMEIEKMISDEDMEAEIVLSLFSRLARFKQEKNLVVYGELLQDIAVLKKLGVTALVDDLTYHMTKFCSDEGISVSDDT